jgi:ABC-type amino acid transport substrate-binding protein
MYLFVLLCFVINHLAPASGQPGIKPQLSKRKLIVGVIDGPPWSMQDDDGHWTGITVDLWREIATALDVAYEFKKYDLNGVQKAIEQGAVDVSAAGLAITSERDARFDFSDPYFVFNQTVAVNSDQQPSIIQVLRATIFSWGFLSLLFLIAALALMGAFVLWLVERKGDSEHYGSEHPRAFVKALFWSVMVLAGRDFPKSIGWTASAPKTFSGRVFGTIWMLFGIMLISLFTAGAASLFTSRQLQSIVNSPDDLGHVRVGTVIGAAGQELLDRRKIKYITYDTPLDLVNALTEHRIEAAVYGGTTLSYYAKRFNNKIIVLRFSLRQDFAALPLQSGSTLRKPINRAILQILDSKRWQRMVADYVGSD